ncbi:acyltransferase [Microbacterium oleivorans]|nr:acyltransferase [Microbacterium oleivorans]
MYHYTARRHTQWEAPTIETFPFVSQFSAYGFMGVQLFFLISGFVILMSVEGRSVGEFVAARISRLFPAYWAAVILTAILIEFIAGDQLGKSVTLVQVLTNLTMLQQWTGVPHVDGVYWTLAVELLFYLLIGIFMKHEADGREDHVAGIPVAAGGADRRPVEHAVPRNLPVAGLCPALRRGDDAVRHLLARVESAPVDAGGRQRHPGHPTDDHVRRRQRGAAHGCRPEGAGGRRHHDPHLRFGGTRHSVAAAVPRTGLDDVSRRADLSALPRPRAVGLVGHRTVEPLPERVGRARACHRLRAAARRSHREVGRASIPPVVADAGAALLPPCRAGSGSGRGPLSVALSAETVGDEVRDRVGAGRRTGHRGRVAGDLNPPLREPSRVGG